jgi:hypothetical protein
MEPSNDILELIKLETNASLGLIATVKFLADFKPSIGMTFSSDGHNYEITGVIVGSNEKFLERHQKNIFDCQVKEI